MHHLVPEEVKIHKLPIKLKSFAIIKNFSMLSFFFPGNQYWFGLRKPPCQFLFGICPCLQLFGNISYSLYSNQGNSNTSTNPISGGKSFYFSEFLMLKLIIINFIFSFWRRDTLNHVFIHGILQSGIVRNHVGLH